MKIFMILIVCAVSITTATELRGMTGYIEPPVQVTGSSIHLVSSTPMEHSDYQALEELLPFYDPPAAYTPIDTLSCSFVVPDKAGIYAAMVSLTTAAIVENSELILTTQAQQAVDIVPGWMKEHLIWKLSILTEDNQDRYGALLLAHQGQNYFDELAFTVAYLSWTILANPSWDETMLVENAELIYTHDPFLSYVNVNDYSGDNYYSTTEYNTIVGSDTVWVEIPKEIYYHYIVMPKVSDERPLNDETVYNETWRQYLWDMDDPGFAVFNEVLNPNVLVFWDETTKNYGWSTTPEFSDSLHAVDIISKWNRSMLPDGASGNRPIQPNVIAHEHNGNCGETQDLLAASARVALIPTSCVMDTNEDHVWCSIWWDGEWRGWYVDTINNHNVAYDTDYGGSKEISCVRNWRNDGFTWPSVDYYSLFCTFTVTVTDSTGTAVDNATVQLASEGWQTSTISRGLWGQTDRNGQITFKLGNNQNYYMNISTSLGSFGGGGYEQVITNSIADQNYTFDWMTPDTMPELDYNEVAEGTTTKYLIQVVFDLPADLMNGRDYGANPRSEYAEPLDNGTADFFIVDSDNWELYQAEEEFDCYEVLQAQSSGEVWFYAPHTDDWYIVFSGDRHQGVETFANTTITLWEHDGTGISSGSIQGIETSIFPNPCVNTASLNFSTATAGIAKVTIYDIHGRIVQSVLNDFIEQGQHSLSVETSDLSSGLYFVNFQGNGLNSMKSLTILR